jgi:Uma2 family endonuclease
MTARARKPATYKDVLAAPANVVAELMFGTLYTHARPAARHAIASSRLGGSLFDPFDRGRGGPGGWVILDEPELHLHADVLVPDLAGWRRTRMPQIPDVAAFQLAPDWVCEVLSPATAATDRVEKMKIYAREKVEFVWLVDPQEKVLEAFTLDDEEWKRVGAWQRDERVRAVPFEALELELGVLWAT